MALDTVSSPINLEDAAISSICDLDNKEALPVALENASCIFIAWSAVIPKFLDSSFEVSIKYLVYPLADSFVVNPNRLESDIA